VDTPTNISSAFITGTAPAGATVTISGSATASTVADTQGNFSITVTLTTQTGLETLNTLSIVYQTSTHESEPALVVILHDPVAPAAPVLQPITSPTSQDSVTIAGTTEPHALIEATGGLLPVSVRADGLGDFSMPMLLLPNQACTLVVTATDLAQNVSGAASAAVTHDDIAPATPDTSRIRAYFDGTDIHVSGGFAAVEGGVTVTLLNLDTLATATFTAQPNGTFSTILTGGGTGQTVEISTIDGALNQDPAPHPTVTESLDWSLVNETSTPTARYAGTMTLDILNNRVILFGGRDATGAMADRTWALDLTAGAETWYPIAAAGGPSARWGHSAVFDFMNQRVAIFGGEDGTTFYNDVWVLDISKVGSEVWTQLAPTGVPPGIRSFHSAVINQWNGEMLVFGGTDGVQTFAGVWGCQLFDILTTYWTSYSTSGSPPTGLSGHSAVVDLTAKHMLVFGGINQGGGYSQTLYQLKLFAPHAWSSVSTTGPTPTARAFHAVAMDHVENRMILFGGDTGTQRVNDLSFFYLGSNVWLSPEAQGAPPSAREHAMPLFDMASLKAFFFGGTSDGATGAVHDDLWQLK
jgi:hypothetical protein